MTRSVSRSRGSAAPLNLPVVLAAAPTGIAATDTGTLAAALSVGAGSVVELRAGTYLINAALSVPAGTTLRGVGLATVIRLADATNTNVLNITGDGAAIRTLTIDGNRANQSSNSNGIHTVYSRTAVRDCRVTSCNGYNIVAFPGATDFTVQGCYSEDARDEGIEVQGATRAVVANNVVKSAGKNGIYVYANTASNSSNTCNDVTITGNVVDGSSAITSGYTGIRVDDRATDVTVAGNVVTGGGTNANGIVVSSSTSYACVGVSVVGNTVRAVTGRGILVASATSVAVTGNNVATASLSGIEVSNGTTTTGAVSVTGNTITGCSRSGILVLDVQNWTVANNVCRNNGQDQAQTNYYNGITIFQSTQTVDKGVCTGNRCYDDQGTKTQQYGIRTLNTIGASVVISQNIVDGNQTDGLTFSFGGATAPSSPPWKLISNVSVSSGGNSIAHGLPYTPKTVMIFMRSAGTVYRAGAPDATNVVLAADSGTRTCDILVG